MLALTCFPCLSSRTPFPSARVSSSSSAQSPTSSPVHPHFCSTKVGAVGRSGRQENPEERTTMGWKSSWECAGAAGIVGQGSRMLGGACGSRGVRKQQKEQPPFV
jgi:hypothetical protein